MMKSRHGKVAVQGVAFFAVVFVSAALAIPLLNKVDESLLKFRPDGSFNIAITNAEQLSLYPITIPDTHYTNGALSTCSDIELDERPCSGLNTTALMGMILDIEKPDFVVFTGDILTGGAINPERSYDEIVAPMVVRGIKWASTYGNHDDESRMNREELIAKDASFYPLSLTKRGPREIHGVSNFALTIEKSDSRDTAYLMYFLDSNAYDSSGAGIGGYDWIHTDQIAWYQQTSNNFKAQFQKTLPALAFFHIPLLEYNNAWDNCQKVNCTGNKYEGVFAANVNSGFYTAVLDQGDIRSMFVGHDHVNDYCGDVYGIQLCYGRATGYTTYGKKGFPRGARVINLNQDGYISQYIRISTGDIIPQSDE